MNVNLKPLYYRVISARRKTTLAEKTVAKFYSGIDQSDVETVLEIPVMADGVQDCTSAFQSAIDFAAISGTVVIPKGIFYIPQKEIKVEE